MAVTSSIMPALDTVAPDFSLPDTEGKDVSLSDFKNAKAYLVMFICNHCPFVKHVRPGIAALGKEYEARGVAVIAINSNDVSTHPDDSPEKMKLEKQSAGYSFPYLYDESQSVARAYQAACTPDFFVFDANRSLAYRGQMDDSRPAGAVPVTGKDLRGALDAILAGRPVSADQRPSIGCNIKWKAGSR